MRQKKSRRLFDLVAKEGFHRIRNGFYHENCIKNVIFGFFCSVESRRSYGYIVCIEGSFFSIQYNKIAKYTRRVDFSAYPISNGIAKDFITSCYSCSKHHHLFEYEDPTLGRARSPASERSTAIPIQMMCRTEEIVDGDEPSSYPWPPVARRAMNNSQGHACIPHRCGIPIVGY
jgi:hypothetical protein